MKKILCLILTVILALGAVFGLTACGPEDKEELVGFDIDFAKEVANDLGLKIEFKEINWKTKETELNSKAIDVIWNGFTYTTERDEGYYDKALDDTIPGLDFTKFYMSNKQVAVVKKDDVENYNSIEDFVPMAGCAEASSAGEEVISDIIEGDVTTLNKQLDCLLAVKAGNYDYAVIDKTLASEYVESTKGAYHDSLAVVEIDEVTDEYYAVAFREGSNLRDVFNYSMAKLYKSGKAQEIAEKYSLGSALYDGFKDINTDSYDFPTDGDYAYVKKNGKIIVGYTIFSPMAYRVEKQA